MKKCLLLFVLYCMTGSAQEAVIQSSFNAQKVIIPSSQYTPASPWQAQVMVFNDGKRYDDADYNKVWGTPSADSKGRQWYETDYELTNGNKSWSLQTAPFSSDETYKGQRSYRWIMSDITGDIYLRRSFTLNQMPTYDVFLTCGHDDAPSEFYLNGTLVHTVSDGWNNDEYVLLTSEEKALLKTDGTENILAVHVHQNWGGAYADCGLYKADMELVTPLLSTLHSGPWPCAYYLLNNNTELSQLKPADWTGRCIDETDWIYGYGPLSNSNDQFLTTLWGSGVQPLLVRRHFQLTSQQIADIADATLTLTCSYDENPRVYLNGTQIWSASGWNDNDYARYILTAANKQLLKVGDNVLCVSLQQGNGGGHIDYGLSITEPYEPQTQGIEPPQRRSNTCHDGFYDLQGRKHSRPEKGLYINNGKKIIVNH